MVPQGPDAASVASLRAVTYRITNTPTQQLPQIAPQIAASLWNCRNLLSWPTDSKLHGEAAVLTHRFNTQLSTLLQDRTVPGRWVAVVITKAAIEAGGFEVLSRSAVWVRSLLGILKRPDPPSTRRLATLVLTRIFVLTWAYSNLVREITTPVLPTFISTCLNNIESKRCSASEVQAVLDSFNTLIARHTTVFRTHEIAIRNLFTRVLSATPSTAGTGFHYTAGHQSSARRLLVLQHSCAPKQGARERWEETFDDVVKAAHAVCDSIFRSITKAVKSANDVEPSSSSKQSLKSDVQSESPDGLALLPWQGINAGGERLVMLLVLLQSHLKNQTGTTISFRVGRVVDLLDRLLSINIPRSGQSDQIKANHDFSEEEREALFSIMPSIHSTAIDTCKVLAKRFGSVSISLHKVLLGMITYVFPSGEAHMAVRSATYSACDTIMKVIGPVMTQDDLADLNGVLRAACMDLLPDLTTKTTGESLLNASANSSKSEISSTSPYDSTRYISAPQTVRDAAANLILCTLESTPAACLGAKLRAQIDRTAVLLQHKDLLLTSVLNPPVKPSDGRVQPSLLPFLARGYTKSKEVESLLRPRLPPIRAGGQSGEVINNVNLDEHDDESNADDKDTDPTSGLLNALTQGVEPSTIARTEGVSQDRLPPRPNQSLPPKRPAASDSDLESIPKRTKSSVVMEQSLSVTDRSLPGLGVDVEQETIPAVIPVDMQGNDQHEVAQTTSVQASVPSSASVTVRSDDGTGSDDSDGDAGTALLTIDSDTDLDED